MKITTRNFGLGSTLITLTKVTGNTISFSDLGARIVSWVVNGKNIVLGFEHAQEYLEKDSFPGATIGRTAGRIKDGRITLNGENIQLNQNEGAQTLHGGKEGFDLKLWRFEMFDQANKVGIHFYLTSPDGENGYPGNLTLRVTHTYDDDDQWEITYKAVSDKDTVFNPTGHVYFNLNGDASQSVENHTLQIAASRFVPLLDQTEIVRGDLVDVSDTAFDFRTEKQIADSFVSTQKETNRALDVAKQIQMVGGIDHPFLLDHPSLKEEQARLTLDDLSVTVKTDQPSIVIFTANFGDLGTIYQGKPQANHGGITFECQVSPGSQQIPELGDITLHAGEEYQATTRYQAIY